MSLTSDLAVVQTITIPLYPFEHFTHPYFRNEHCFGPKNSHLSAKIPISQFFFWLRNVWNGPKIRAPQAHINLPQVSKHMMKKQALIKISYRLRSAMVLRSSVPVAKINLWAEALNLKILEFFLKILLPSSPIFCRYIISSFNDKYRKVTLDLNKTLACFQRAI